MTTRITHIGGPTTLLEVDGWRLLTDPTFDPPGRRYTFGWGSSSRKLTGPAVAAGLGWLLGIGPAKWRSPDRARSCCGRSMPPVT